MKPARAWVLLASGQRLNLIDPQPDSWTDRDLAIGLSPDPVLCSPPPELCRTMTGRGAET